MLLSILTTSNVRLPTLQSPSALKVSFSSLFWHYSRYFVGVTVLVEGFTVLLYCFAYSSENILMKQLCAYRPNIKLQTNQDCGTS